MIASFHLVKYRRRRFLPPRPPGADGLEFWRPLSTGPDFRRIPAGFGSLDLAKPNFRRWGFFGVWRDERAVERFLGVPAAGRDWRAGAEETWDIRLRPIRCGGTWEGSNPLGAFDATGLPGEPVVALTRGDVRLARLPAFWFGATKIAVTDVRLAPGFLAGIAMTQRPFLDVSTLTIWKSLDDAVDFAYRRRAHSSLVARNREERIFSAFFFAYFSPSRSSGTWDGRDPLA
jgi:hypothetical protein